MGSDGASEAYYSDKEQQYRRDEEHAKRLSHNTANREFLVSMRLLREGSNNWALTVHQRSLIESITKAYFK